VRPEDVAIGDPLAPEGDIVADVDRVEPLGNEVLVHVRRDPGVTWVARARPDWAGQPGERVGLRLDRSRIHLFDRETGRRL
jgi:ABC-type sugar transport system ATPase subunit